MTEVFAKTRELAEAIKQSTVYTMMKEAEDKALKNEEAAAIMAQYIEKQNALEAVMMKGDAADVNEMQEISDEMESLQKQLNAVEDIIRLTAARNAFTNLINQVNEVLRFTITGEMSMDENCESAGSSSCTGSCATCRGCH